jgi:hypothetical protein
MLHTLRIAAAAAIVVTTTFIFVAPTLIARAANGTAGGTHTIDTNVAHSDNAPAWVTGGRIDPIEERVADKLGGADFHKIRLTFYTDQTAFRKAHGFDDTVLAFTIKPENAVSIGPRVTTADFDPIFGHELVHVILYQKYKNAVPSWLEEGLANYLVHYGKVDYRWLASQPDRDVSLLAHPFGSNGRIMPGGARYAYQASQALMEMIATHCEVTDLVSMSVGKKLQDYLPTMCGIDDLNGEFRKWVKSKAGKH